MDSNFFHTRQFSNRYVFIDGEYLTQLAIKAGEKWFGKKADLDFSKIHEQLDGRRTFYYDCLPAKSDKEKEEIYQARFLEKSNLFNRLRTLPGWHVNEGIAKWRKKTGTSQKEVDVLIAVDMLTHTYRKNMDAITFIAGDLDFRPLVEAIVREGMYISLQYGQMSITDDLKNSADEAIRIGPNRLLKFCSESFQKEIGFAVPSIEVNQPPGEIELVAKDENNNVIAFLISPTPSDEYVKILIRNSAHNQDFLIIRHKNKDRIRAFYEADYGPVQWVAKEQNGWSEKIIYIDSSNFSQR